jgi:hypothetical protein
MNVTVFERCINCLYVTIYFLHSGDVTSLHAWFLLCLHSKLKRKTNEAVRQGDVWESVDIAPPFFISELDGGEWSAARSGRFILGKRTPGAQQIGLVDL